MRGATRGISLPRHTRGANPAAQTNGARFAYQIICASATTAGLLIVLMLVLLSDSGSDRERVPRGHPPRSPRPHARPPIDAAGAAVVATGAPTSAGGLTLPPGVTATPSPSTTAAPPAPRVIPDSSAVNAAANAVETHRPVIADAVHPLTVPVSSAAPSTRPMHVVIAMPPAFFEFTRESQEGAATGRGPGSMPFTQPVAGDRAARLWAPGVAAAVSHLATLSTKNVCGITLLAARPETKFDGPPYVTDDTALRSSLVDALVAANATLRCFSDACGSDTRSVSARVLRFRGEPRLEPWLRYGVVAEVTRIAGELVAKSAADASVDNAPAVVVLDTSVVPSRPKSADVVLRAFDEALRTEVPPTAREAAGKVKTAQKVALAGAPILEANSSDGSILSAGLRVMDNHARLGPAAVHAWKSRTLAALFAESPVVTSPSLSGVLPSAFAVRAAEWVRIASEVNHSHTLHAAAAKPHDQATRLMQLQMAAGVTRGAIDAFVAAGQKIVDAANEIGADVRELGWEWGAFRSEGRQQAERAVQRTGVFFGRNKEHFFAFPGARGPLSDERAVESACDAVTSEMIKDLPDTGCAFFLGDTFAECAQDKSHVAENKRKAEQLGLTLDAVAAPGLPVVVPLMRRGEEITTKLAWHKTNTAPLDKEFIEEMRAVADRFQYAMYRAAAIVDALLRDMLLSCDSAPDVLTWSRVLAATHRLGLAVAVAGNAAVSAAHPPMPTTGLASDIAEAPAEVRYTHSLHGRPQWGVLDSANDRDFAVLQTLVNGRLATSTLTLHWQTPCCQCCGFSQEWAWLSTGIARFIPVTTNVHGHCHCRATDPHTLNVAWTGFKPIGSPASCRLVQSRSFSHAAARIDPVKEIDERVGALLPDAITERPVEIEVHHWDPINAATFDPVVCQPRRRDYIVSRSMYEFGTIPPEWVGALNNADMYDAIWVPCEYVKQSFIDSGVKADRIDIVPEALDTDKYDPQGPRWKLPHDLGRWRYAHGGNQPGSLDEGATYFKFFSVFKWESRKGWDALMRAYFKAFTRKDNVTMYIVTVWNVVEMSATTDWRDADSIVQACVAIAESLSIPLDQLPHWVIITDGVSDEDMVRLYRSADAFVLPSRGEGWGLPVIQAMAMALPTITTRHSGMLGFTTNDTVLYVDVKIETVPPLWAATYTAPGGATWGEPNLDMLTAAMAQVRRNMTFEERKALGTRARRHIVENFNIDVVGRFVARKLLALEPVLRERRARRVDTAQRELRAAMERVMNTSAVHLQRLSSEAAAAAATTTPVPGTDAPPGP